MRMRRLKSEPVDRAAFGAKCEDQNQDAIVADKSASGPFYFADCGLLSFLLRGFTILELQFCPYAVFGTFEFKAIRLGEDDDLAAGW